MGRATKQNRKTGAVLFAVGLVGLVLFNSVAGVLWGRGLGWGDMFVADVALFAAAMAGAGLGLKGQLTGIAVDPRNRISLARLQMALWTLIVLSALACALTARLRLGVGADSAVIRIPGEVLAAMGIAATSLVMAPTILSLKPEEQLAPGRVAVRAEDEKGQFLDIIRGDEAGNADTIDLSKLQQLTITLMVIGVYAVVLYGYFAQVGLLRRPQWSMPELGLGLVELMAISHAGYLAYKAAPKPAAATTSDPTLGEEVAQAH